MGYYTYVILFASETFDQYEKDGGNLLELH